VGVPACIHPAYLTDTVRERLYSGNFSEFASVALGGFGWVWHSDVGLHVPRVFASGVFDRFPRLKVVISHMGEMIPFMLERIVGHAGRWGSYQRFFKTVWDTDIWITTSEVWSVDPLACILRNTKIDHIMYSVDYTFSSNQKGLKFLEDLQRSGLVDEKQFKQIVSGNAVELLGLLTRLD
jgi:predicted TIM-barrel fold metal-dependent hydrolase